MVLQGSWRGVFEQLSPQGQGEVYLFAYEAVARFVDRLSGSELDPDGQTVGINSAAQFLKDYDVYVRKARRYQMRQTEIQEWTVKDLSRTLAWKAAKEVQDHLRKIRRGLSKPDKVVRFPRYSDEQHKSWVLTIINYFEGRETKTSRDAALLIEMIWRHSSALTQSPGRGISFKAKAIATELTREHNEIWNTSRVQRARAFILKEMSQTEGDSVADVVHHLLRARNKKDWSAR
jgi:hypothetical protein